MAVSNRALALKPNNADAFHNRSIILERLRRVEEALASVEAALALRPVFAEALNQRGSLLAATVRLDEAIASYDRALAANPNYAEAFNNKGVALAELGREPEALASYDQALALWPDYAEAHTNRGNVLRNMARHAEALTSHERALAIKPNSAEMLCNRGIVLGELWRFGDGIRDCERALAIQPVLPKAEFAMACMRLAIGDFKTGLELYEARYVKRKMPQPQWDGKTALAGKTILLHHEQGYGDTIQFCRYVPLVAQQTHVVLVVPRALRRLLATLSGGVDIVAADESLPRFDTHCPLPSLPWAFHTTVDTIPQTVPCLAAAPGLVAAWRARMSNLPGLRIGIAWAGDPRPGHAPEVRAVDRRRSMPMSNYAPLARIAEISLVSLQKGEAAHQAASPPCGMTIWDFTEDLTDFADTAALIEALDLVITVDTAVAHLAGALGKPVWILNRFDACWRWLTGRTASPWYPTARLFRQPSPGAWDAVIADVATALRGLAH